MAKLRVTKSVTNEYSDEYDEHELAAILGLQPDELSTAGLIEYIEQIDGDLSALHEALEHSRECTSSTWTVTTIR